MPKNRTESPISKTVFIKNSIIQGELSKPAVPGIGKDVIEKTGAAVDNKTMVTYDDFRKLDIRIGKIVSAEKVAGTDKLLKLNVDIGAGTRQLVAGIAESYEPDLLIGKEVPVLLNLEPRKIRGVESQGMILAADIDGKPVLLHPDEEVRPGSVIR